MNKKTRLKYEIREDGVLQYTWIPPRIAMHILASDEEGVIWCQNCYNDKKPVLTVSFDLNGEGKWIDLIQFCEDCLKVYFKIYREKIRR